MSDKNKNTLMWALVIGVLVGLTIYHLNAWSEIFKSIINK